MAGRSQRRGHSPGHASPRILIYNEVFLYHDRGGSSGEGAGDAHPTPPPRDDLRLSNTTGILPKQKKTLCFIGAEVKHETRLKNYVKRKIEVKMVVP